MDIVNMENGVGGRSQPKKGELGASLIELALVLPFFLGLFLGVVEFGRLFYIAAEVSTAAHAGAIYGTHNPSDVAGMQAASQEGSANLSGLTTTAAYGCECADGTNAVSSCGSTPTCSYNYVTFVDVAASATYVPIFHYPGLPSTVSITKETRMRVGGN